MAASKLDTCKGSKPNSGAGVTPQAKLFILRVCVQGPDSYRLALAAGRSSPSEEDKDGGGRVRHHNLRVHLVGASLRDELGRGGAPASKQLPGRILPAALSRGRCRQASSVPPNWQRVAAGYRTPVAPAPPTSCTVTACGQLGRLPMGFLLFLASPVGDASSSQLSEHTAWPLQ